MRVDLGAQTDFLEFTGLGVTLGFLFFFTLLVFPFAVIHDSADGRLSLRGDFNKIQSRITGTTFGGVSIHDTDFFVVFVYQKDSWGANIVVDAKTFCG